MNREEVIKILNETKLCSPIGQAAFVAIEDVKKQIAKKPNNIKGTCPNCNNIISINLKYCHECGQKLAW